MQPLLVVDFLHFESDYRIHESKAKTTKRRFNVLSVSAGYFEVVGSPSDPSKALAEIVSFFGIRR